MLTLSVVATKGGVGKTTLCANIGGLLADMGYRVLLIDADIQPALTRHFQLSHVAEHGLTTMLQRGALADDCISHVSLPPETFRGDISVLNVRGCWRRPKTEPGEQPTLLFFCAAEDKE